MTKQRATMAWVLMKSGSVLLAAYFFILKKKRVPKQEK
jgi:hypothetical protein